MCNQGGKQLNWIAPTLHERNIAYQQHEVHESIFASRTSTNQTCTSSCNNARSCWLSCCRAFWCVPSTRLMFLQVSKLSVQLNKKALHILAQSVVHPQICYSMDEEYHSVPHEWQHSQQNDQRWKQSREWLGQSQKLMMCLACCHQHLCVKKKRRPWSKEGQSRSLPWKPWGTWSRGVRGLWEAAVRAGVLTGLTSQHIYAHLSTKAAD